MLLRENKVIQSVQVLADLIPPKTMVHIVEAMTGHEALTKLSIIATGEDGNIADFRLFQANTRLKMKLQLHNNLNDSDVVALAASLRRNTSFENISLCNNRIGPQGAAALANVLYNDATLEVLNVRNNPVGNDGAASFAKVLVSNTTLKTLRISHFGETGLNVFSSCLPSMNGLRTLNLSNIDGLSLQSASQFLEALERNTELDEVAISASDCKSDTGRLIDEMKPKVELQMTLNRGLANVSSSRRACSRLTMATHPRKVLEQARRIVLFPS